MIGFAGGGRPSDTAIIIVGLYVLGTVINLLLWVALPVTIALLLRRGLGWVRIVLVIFAAISVASGILGEFYFYALAALAIAAAVLVWTRRAGEYLLKTTPGVA
jgi:hypothetical protein